MRYPEDVLFELVQCVNPKATINRHTVYVDRREVVRLNDKSGYGYMATLHSKPGGMYYGDEYIRYDKYNMTTYTILHPLVIKSGPPILAWELLNDIECQFGFKVRREDIVNTYVTPEKGIKLANLCILYEGTIRVVYQDNIDLEDVITEPVLDGFKQEILDEQRN